MSYYKRPSPPSITQLQRQCDAWNRRWPVGTTVHYYPVMGNREHRTHKTRSEAQILSGHTAVIFLEGQSGCVALAHCIPVEGAAA